MSAATVYSFHQGDEFDIGPRLQGLALHADDADRLICRDMIKTGSRSFYAASLLLPEQIRDAAYALYGFCRLSDDAVDGTEPESANNIKTADNKTVSAKPGGGTRAIQRLKVRLNAVYSGQPISEAPDRCLADVVTRFGIPRAMFDALMEGFEWDVSQRTYHTLDDVEAYGERVAGSVGGMMAALMDARSPAMVERACDLGVAMQLTNIARDVGEDARNGRLYLPRQWFLDAGLDPDAWLAQPDYCEEIGEMTALLLSRAEALYKRADQAIARLPPTVRPAIYAARLLYAEIGKVVASQNYDSISTRARTSAGRKAWLVGAAMQRAAKPAPKAALPIQDGIKRALVAAVVHQPAPALVLTKPSPTVKDDLNWVLDLFSDLEQRDRLERPR